MDLIKDINNTIRDKDTIEAAIEETKPKEDIGKTISDYLADIKAKKTS